MTAQRLVRGSKARIIASICGIIFCAGILVLFQKSQTQLENVNKNYEICVQQQESLSTQLQVIVDYKTRLEKSLQLEKAEHKQTRTELESRINDEKTRRDKTSMEANLRFQTLQQHYKLLQTKQDDLTEKSDKLQQKYLDETDKLQAKVKELQEQVKQAEIDKLKSLEHLKTLYVQLQDEKDRLVAQIKNTKDDRTKWESDVNHLTLQNHQLQRELDKYKSHGIRRRDEDTIAAPQQANEDEEKAAMITTTRKFAKQVEISKDTYEIRTKENKAFEDEKQEVNLPQVDAPHQEHFDQQNAQNVVLQKPSSPSKSTTKSSSVSKGNLANARPLLLPTVTPSTKNISKIDKFADSNTNVLPVPNFGLHRKLPPGVVPIPMEQLPKTEQKNEKSDDKNNIPEEINLALPNRYRSNIIEAELANEIIKETKVEPKPVNLQNEPEINMGLDINQQDNAAMEVMDHPKNPAQEDPLHLMEENGAGMDTNDIKELDPAKDPVVALLENKKLKKQHIDTLRAVARDNGDTGALRAPPGGGMFENEADYDKDGQKEDLQIEEAEPEGEEDDDVDDYDGHIAARQKDPAVRN